MMKNYYLTIVSLLLLNQNAFSDEWNWSQTYGSTGNEIAVEIINDSQGNQFITGNFEETISFGDYTLSSEGGYDGYLSKIDPEGNLLWAVRIGGEDGDEIKGIDIDAEGYVYITGSFQLPQATFQSTVADSTVITSVGYRDFFIAKYTNDGELLWVYSAGSDQEWCVAYAHSVSVDNYGNAYVAGQFWKHLEIGGNLLSSEGYGDAFVAKINSQGEVQWANKLNCSYHGRAYEVTTDILGNVFVAGLFEEQHITFPDTTFYATQPEVEKFSENQNLKKAFQLSENNYRYQNIKVFAANDDNQEAKSEKFIFIPIVEDAFLVKYDPAGNYQWARHISGNQDEQIGGLITDAEGDIFIGFNWMDNITVGDSIFNAAMGGIDITYYDITLASFDNDGQFLWANQEGSETYFIWIKDISSGADNRIFISGQFSENATFGRNTTVTANGSGAGFLSVYENQGDFVHVETVDGDGWGNTQYIAGVCHNPDTTFTLFGGFSEDIILDDITFYSEGLSDLFVARKSIDLPPPILDLAGPTNLSAEVFDQFNVNLSWDSLPGLPGEATELYYGDINSLGTMMSPEAHMSVGYQHNSPVFLTSIKSYVAPSTNFVQDVTFYVYGDLDGLPDQSNILGGPYVVEVPGGNLGNALWIQADFEGISIAANEVFHLVQNWEMNEMEIGSAKSVPATLSSIYYMGQWMALTDIGLNQGFIIRALISDPEPLLGYNVFRDGYKLNDNLLETNSFQEFHLENGIHEYSVTGLYEAGQTQHSDPVLVEIDFPDHGTFTVNISTNSSDSPEEAIVTLTNHDNDPGHEYTLTATAGGLVEFPQVWSGWGDELYDLKINHPRFENFISTDISITSEGGSLDVILTEYLASPYNPEIVTEGFEPGQAMFSWNNLQELNEDFEGDVFPPLGWAQFNLDGGTGWQQVNDGDTPPGWQGGVLEAAPDGGLKMAFVTYITGGENTNDQWLISPEVVVADDFQLSFYLRYMPFFEDNVEIRISTTSQDDPEAFDIVIDQIHFQEESNMDWQLYSYNLTDFVPSGTPVYIAFREHMESYPEGSPIILLDNVYAGPSQKQPSSGVANINSEISGFNLNPDRSNIVNQNSKVLIGYNVYLNDLNTPVATGLNEPNYLFDQLQGGEYTAGVQAVYSTGESSIVTIDFIVEEIAETFQVTFNVDMTYAEEFDPENDVVYITGSFIEWDEPGTNQEFQVLTRIDDSDIWTTTLEMDAGNYEYKFYINNGWEGAEWTGTDNRTIQIEGDLEINHWFGYWQDPTGVTQPDFAGSLRVFPNPASGYFKIASDNFIEEVTLFDLTGRTILSEIVGNNFIQVSVENVKEGIYLLHIITKKGTSIQKLQIVR